jgi:hypothetical protein
MTANEWNTIDKTVSVIITSALNTQSPNNQFSALTDNAGAVAAVQFSTATAQTQNSKEIFKVEFSSTTQLDALYIKKTTATEIFAATTLSLQLQGSNDNNSWTDLTDAITRPSNGTNITANGAVSLTNSNKFTITKAAGKYKYYRIYGVGANAANISNGIASEFYFDVNNATYQASYFPKATCTNDIDGDGKLNHQDLDSDGDGCSDALESGAITSTTSNFQFTGTATDFGTNGLINTKETLADNGLLNYTPTYSFAIASNYAACSDTDGDGINDVIDIDDDNDGVLDAVESPACFFSPVEWNSTVKTPFVSISSELN